MSETAALDFSAAVGVAIFVAFFVHFL